MYFTEVLKTAVNKKPEGTKSAAVYDLNLKSGEERVLRMRLTRDDLVMDDPFSAEFEQICTLRKREADEFYESKVDPGLSADERRVLRQASAGLLWTKQFYYYVVEDWLEGDDPANPLKRTHPRNRDWKHLFNRNILSVPDKWEYPWYAAWDSAFHMIPFANHLI